MRIACSITKASIQTHPHCFSMTTLTRRRLNIASLVENYKNEILFILGYGTEYISVFSYLDVWSHLQPTARSETSASTNTHYVTHQKSNRSFTPRWKPQITQAYKRRSTFTHFTDKSSYIAAMSTHRTAPSDSWQNCFLFQRCQDRFLCPKRAVLILKIFMVYLRNFMYALVQHFSVGAIHPLPCRC